MAAKAMAAATIMLVGLAGCAQDGIEFQGKIFEAVGLAGDTSNRGQDTKAAQRSPLVLPPDTTKLPAPGEAPPPVVANQEWPRDRDAMRQADADARKRAHEQYCRDGNWREKALDKDASPAQGPMGSCQGSVLGWMNNGLFGNKD